MKGLVGFFKLVRPVNLLIIVFTMVAIRYGVLNGISARYESSPGLQMDSWKFGLSILVMVLLAAAGNIINDYFDVRVDRINKPERVIVGKVVKRRVAMISHHALNAVAVLIGLFLAWDSGQYWTGLIPVVMGTLLWFYSVKFKKAPWIGNFVVALMVGVVPIWTGLFEIPLLVEARASVISSYTEGSSLDVNKLFELILWATVFGFSIFAFWLTLIREVIKDLEDFRGDHMAGYRTLPIVWGIKNTKLYVVFLFVVFTAALVYATMFLADYTERSNLAWQFWTLFVLGIVVPSISAFIKVMRATRKSDYKVASVLVKVIMASGILIGFLMRYWH